MPKTPEQHIQARADSATQSLQAAATWRTKHHPRWELFLLYQAMTDILTVAVKRYKSADDASSFLADPERQSAFDRATILTCEIYAEGNGPPADTPPPGISCVVTLVHFLWFTERFDQARSIARICDNTKKLKFFQWDPFWRDYGRAMARASEQQRFTPESLDLSGYQEHWHPYLLLLSDITHRRDPSESLAKVDKSFAKRKTDKRLINGEFDGDGTFPAHWDFRLTSILCLARTFTNSDA